MAFPNVTTTPLTSGGQDDLDMLAISLYSAAGTISRSTAWPQTGAGCVAYDQTTNGNKAISLASASLLFTTASVTAFSFAAAVSATPSSAAGLLYHYATTGAVASGGKRYIRVETDLKLGICDKNGNLLGKSATAVPSGASGTPQEFSVIFDGLTLPSVFVTIFAGDAVDTAFDTGLSWATMFDTSANGSLWWGEYLDGSTNRGCSLFIDDGLIRRSTTASDAPHSTAYPRVRVSEPVNSTTGTVGTGNWTAGHWDEGSGGAGASFAEVDNTELPTHDSDGTYLQSTVASEAFLLSSTDANPVPSGATIIKVEQRHVGRLTGAGKLIPVHRYRLGGTNSDVDGVSPYGSVSSTYVGGANSNMTRPGGGSWVDTDFAASTLEWGIKSDATTPGYRVTLMLGPSVAYYTDTLPLGTRPQAADREVVARGVGMGVMVGVG